eukprot:scaffold3666_cov81-Skeletonema_dohrnii-CCMP3373.AAC.2
MHLYSIDALHSSAITCQPSVDIQASTIHAVLFITLGLSSYTRLSPLLDIRASAILDVLFCNIQSTICTIVIYGTQC